MVKECQGDLANSRQLHVCKSRGLRSWCSLIAGERRGGGHTPTILDQPGVESSHRKVIGAVGLTPVLGTVVAEERLMEMVHHRGSLSHTGD